MHKVSSDNAKILIVESVYKKGKKNEFSPILDIHMMSMYTGKERSRADFEKLLAESGWKLSKLMEPKEGIVSVIEAVKAK